MQADSARFVAISRASSPGSPACWPGSARASSPPTTEFDVTHVPVAKGRKPQAEQRMVELDIHHSFLPAFLGGSPYIETYRRGVKLDRRDRAPRTRLSRRRPDHRTGRDARRAEHVGT
jgi:hypothetical protein